MPGYLSPQGRVGVPLLVAIAVEVAFDNICALGAKYAIDAAVSVGDRAQFFSILMLLGGVFVAGPLDGLARDRLSAALGARVLRDIQAGLFDQLQRLSASFYARREADDLAARFSCDLAAVENGCNRALPLAVHSLLVVGSSGPLLFLLDWRLSLATLAMLPAALIGPRLRRPRATGAVYKRARLAGGLLRTVQETIAGQRVPRAFGLEGRAWASLDAQPASLARASLGGTFLKRLGTRRSYAGSIFGQIAIVGATRSC
jgi:ATP-binding cassette subfamily B protein